MTIVSRSLVYPFQIDLATLHRIPILAMTTFSVQMIVLIISVRDESQFVHANIQHHLDIGVDRFVITEICSSDGTREMLQEYDGDKRFHITYLDDQDIRKYDWTQKMVDIAKEHFGASWISLIDADEFLLPKSGDLKNEVESLPDRGYKVNRCNVAFSEEIAFQDYYRINNLADAPIVAKPDPNTRTYLMEGKPHPWILGPIGSKVISRADYVDEFTRGGHEIVNSVGHQQFETTTDNLIMLHFPFTTYNRFHNKILNIAGFEKLMWEVNKDHPDTAWQWHHWVRVLEHGDAALRAEFDLQMIPRERLLQMEQEGTVMRAESVFNLLGS